MSDLTSRRTFLKAGSAAGLIFGSSVANAAQAPKPRPEELARLMTAPVLRRELLTSPVRIESIDLIKAGDQFLVRARSTDGAIGMAAGHPDVLETTWPILTSRVAPFFAKKDARDLETLLDELYVAGSNYKWQGLPFWVPVASVEIAILDLLGQVARKPFGELFGPIVRRDVAVYRASGNRGNSAAAELEYLQQLVGEIGAKAIKFRLGARMRYDDASTKRDLALIPLTRKTFGAAMAIHADANSSYDVPMALRIGRLMHEQRFAFFEEPVPFDFYDETREVADALTTTGRGRRTGQQPSPLPLDDRASRRRHRPARPVLFRRFHPIDPGRADGRRGGHGLHPAHVGRRPRLPLRRPFRILRAECGPVPGIQGSR